MNHRIFRDNVWITLVPHPDTEGHPINIDEYEPRIKLALLELENLKVREPDLDVRFYTDHETGFEINTAFGMQTITVRGFPEEVVVQKEKEKALEATFESYVLLVEMGTEPGAFAVFRPDGEGHGATGGMGANMSFVGWSNAITENQDPPGLVGQPTFRVGWLNDPAPPLSSDYPGTGYIQVKRVDQGGLAYSGKSRNPIEVTRLIADAEVGTYEDIPFPEHWISVEPGPPPYWLCGYTWAISENHGGPGGGDFSDTRHLFFGLQRYDGTLAQWWPPEFNQLITIERKMNREGVLVPYWAAFQIWPGDASDDGLEQYYGEYIVPGSFSKITQTTNDTVRMWGLIHEWGSYLYPISDSHFEPCSFPYTQWTDKDPLVLATIKTDHCMGYLLGGVHVADAWQLYAISGLRFWPQGRTTEHRWGWYVGKRKAWTKEEEIASNIDDGGAWPYWTERMDIILQGNEDSVSGWVLNSFTGLYSASEWFYERDRYIIGVLAGGLKYYIRNEEPENYSGAFCDYGIFTKRNTGINSFTGEVDKDTIEPIYAYAMKTGQTYPYTVSLSSTHLDTAGIIYGMIIDGQHFMTEEFAYLGGDNGMANDINNGDFDIPGARSAVDSDGNPVTARPKVRVGLMLQYYPDTTINTGE